MRLAVISIVAMLAAPVLIADGWVGCETWTEFAFNRNTPLAAKLYGQWDAMRDTFRQRVRKQFPVGTPVTNVVAALISQGFKPTGWHSSSGFPNPDDETVKFDAMPMRPTMTVMEPRTFCNISWTVAWDLDANQQITRTYGELEGYCL